MQKFQSFQEFLATQSIDIEPIAFIINLLLAALLSYLLSRMYVRFGTSLSNRGAFAKNFVLISMTTMLIITIVKSSLALSLGLVGALSIVRFRAAIKEPEELAFLFLAIAIGLGLGADQRVITIVAFLVISLIALVGNYARRHKQRENLHLTVASNQPEKITLERIVETLKEHCTLVNLRRFDETADTVEATFLVEFMDFAHANSGKTALQKLGDSVRVTFLDNTGAV